MDMTPQTWPEWYDGRHINEVLFCQQFLEKHPMKCVRGRLFTVDGLIEDFYDRGREETVASTAPLGGSAGTEPGQGTQGPYP